LLTQFGLASSLSFVHRDSRYIGKFWTAFTTYQGWKLHKRAEEYHRYAKRLTNFQLYPRDIQVMLENNDYRYGRRWLQDAWLEEVNREVEIQEESEQEAPRD
jgi:hypothetical protein